MTRGGPERNASVVEVKRTRKDIIADELRKNFLEWGFDPQVSGEIVNWGRIRIRKGVRGNITSFKLIIKSVTSHGYNRETEIRYSHHRRGCRILVTYNGPEMLDKSRGVHGISQVKNIRLGEEIIDGEQQKILIFKGEWPLIRGWAIGITQDGFLIEGRNFPLTV